MHLLDHQNNEAEADRIEGRIDSSTTVLEVQYPIPLSIMDRASRQKTVRK